MIINKELILWVAVVVLIFFNIRQCSEKTKTKTVEVEVPEEKGSFKIDSNVINIPIIKKDSIVYRDRIKDTIIYRENPFNKELEEEYIKLKNDFDRYEMFLEAIEIKAYNKHFENELFKASVTGRVQGEVISMGLDYTIKPRNVYKDIEVKNYRWGIGVQTGVTYINQSITPYVGIGLTYSVIRF